MAKTKKVKQRIVRIELQSELESGQISNTLILDFNSGLHYKKSYLGAKEDALLNLNVGDDVVATVSVADNNVIFVKPFKVE